MFHSAGCELYVGNLDSDVTEEILFSYFSRFGNIQFLKIMRHLITHQSRGFGFITFRARQEALKAQKGMHGFKIMKNSIKVYLKEQYDNLDPQANLVITDFPTGVTEEELSSLAEKHGPVFSVKIVQAEEGEGKTGVKAYVQYENIEAAKKALQALQGTELKGHKLAVDQAGKRNKLYLRADYSENIIDQLRNLLSAWEPIEISNLEISVDKTQCVVQIKLESEQVAKALLQDFHGDKSKCKLSRSHHQGRLRAF
jgi:RNA recognition motif-containing protein